MQRGAEILENTAFSGFSHLPLSSVKFRQVRFLTLDSKTNALFGSSPLKNLDFTGFFGYH